MAWFCAGMRFCFWLLVCMGINIYVCLRVDVSIVVMGDANDTIEYDKRASELSNAALHMK